MQAKILCATIVSLVVLPAVCDYWTDSTSAITWRYVVKEGNAWIGDGSFYGRAIVGQYPKEISIPTFINGMAVSGISDYAFCSNGYPSVTNIEKLIVGENVKWIGKDAFKGCIGLAHVQYSSGLQSIGHAAFQGCSQLESIALPSTVTNLEAYAFAYCTALKSVSIPDGVDTIKEFSFSDCKLLRELSLPFGLIAVDSCAFLGCEGLETVMLPANVERIDKTAFSGCSAIKTISVPKCVDSMAEWFGCYKDIVNVTLCDLTGEVASHMFHGCSSLHSVRIPKTVRKIGESAFRDCGSITSFDIMEGISSIGAAAFEGCENLESVFVPTTVHCLPEKVFSGCESLSNVILSEGVEEIGEYAFEFCSNLREILLPTTVKEVAKTAFPRTCAVLRKEIVVNVIGRTDDVCYDGQNHPVFVLSSENPSAIADVCYMGDCPLAKDVGLYRVELDSQKFINTNANFSVRFEVLSAAEFQVLPREVTVYSGAALKRYDGVPLISNDITIDGEGFVSGECAVSARGSQTSVGSSKNMVELHWADDARRENYIIKIKEGLLRVSPGRIAEDDCEPGLGSVPENGVSKYDGVPVKYDGRGHTLNVDALSAIELAGSCPNFSYALTSNGVYRTEPYYFTNACVTSIWYKISADNYDDFVHEAQVTILPRTVKLTSGSAQKQYDGIPLLSSDLNVEEDGFADKEGVVWACRGSQTEVGQSDNEFCFTFKEGTFESNYIIIKKCGRLVVDYAGRTSTPTISSIESHGDYVEVWLEDEMVDSEIFYTLNGETPTTASELYVGPIIIEYKDEKEVLLQAVAIRKGYALSDALQKKIQVLTPPDGSGNEIVALMVQQGALNSSALSISYNVTGNTTWNKIPVWVDVIIGDFRSRYNLNNGDKMAEYGAAGVHSVEVDVSDVLAIGDFSYNKRFEVEVFVGESKVSVEESAEIKFDFLIKDGWLFGRSNQSEVVGILQFPSNVVGVVGAAFEDDYYLDNVVISDSVEIIGDASFANCTDLTCLTFGEGIKSIGASAFVNCISLESVILKEGVKRIGMNAFAATIGTMRLKSVSLPASLLEIADGAFSGCPNITGVTVPTHLKTMAQLFPNSYEKIESVVIPEGETVIVDDMFKGCKALKTVVIPNSVTNIGASAFESCEALEELGLPDSVTSLGGAAFAHCLNLKTVALSKGLTAIVSRTFAECPLLDSLVVPAAVTSMGACIYIGAYVDVGYGQGGIYQKIDGRYAYWRYDAALTGIYFLGDAPEVRSDTYEGMPSEAKSYVVKGSKGWYLAGSPTLPPDGWPTCGNARAITYWTPNRFDVTFDGNGGTPETYAAEQITDTTYSLPKTNPTRTGYLFDGWWTEPKAGAQIYWNTRVTATKAHTLYAHWKSLKDGITVIFNPNGGTVSPDEVEYPAGVTYGELPVPTRIGHEFLGWYTSQVGGNLVTEATEVHKENNELYAHWRPITYWVVFDANGGYGSMERQLHTYNEAKMLLANQYYLNGFKFTGWAETRGGAVKYADQKEVENLAEIQGQEVTLYAVWNGASYAVRFDGNGGTGSMENQTFVVGVSQGLAECQYTRTGYAFAGWATTPAGTVAYKDKEDVKNLTMTSGATVNLYAVWTPIQYLISYNANGGGGAMSATVAIYDEEVVLPESAFSWAGHRFVGWAMEADGEVVYEAGQRVQNLASQSGVNVILYAVWELEQVAMPTVSPADGTVFETSCQVTLACSTVGASIYYRVGAQPKATDRFKYTQPFEISETSVIYAFAKLGELQSETISVTLTKGEVLTFAKAVNAVGVDTFELGGDDVWKVIETDGAKFDAACVQSGEIGDNQISWFKTTVQGAGTIRFWWKASCEEDELKDFDHLVFVIDGHEFGRLDGITDWIEMLVPVQTAGPHTLMWAYVKDDGLAEGDDCGWVDGISWEPLAVVDPIPEINSNADAKAVQAALDGSADARLTENVTDAATYNAYREWALKIGASDVKASPFAWASFATDSAALLAKMPTDDDLKVEEFKPSATAGTFDFTVGVKDVTIGDKASVDNLKKLFGLEGAESLDTAAFSSEKVALDFKEPQDGKLKFSAIPAVDNAKSFFMKVKVK